MAGPPVSRRIPGTAARWALVVVGCLAVAFACISGEGVEAPRTLSPDEDSGRCPSADDVLDGFQERLAAGDLDPLRPHVERVLVEERGLATALSFAAQVLPDIDADAVPTLLAALRDEGTIAPLQSLSPTLFSVVDYLHGSHAALPGPHDAPLVAAHAIVTACDAPATVQMVRDLLALQVRPGSGGEPRWVGASPPTATRSWLFAFVDVAARATRNPSLQTMLENIEISDEQAGGDGSIRVGRDAFVVLSRLLAANIAAPDFDSEATRSLVEDVLLPRLGDDTAARVLLDEILDLVAVLADNRSTTFPALQEFMACVDRHDQAAAIPGMLFDFLTTEEIAVPDLLVELADAGANDGAGRLRVAVVALFDAALSHPEALGDLATVAARLLEPDPVADILDVIVAVRGTGVFTELLSLLDTLLTCKGVEP